MRIPDIYTQSALSEHTEINLGESEAQHLVKVLRMKVGFKLRLFNGDGSHYDAEIIEATKKALRVAISNSSSPDNESPIHTHIGQVMSRGDRMDYAIQKSTELGVNEITPLISERCEVKLDEQRQKKRLAHWQQIAISACEQCGRAVVPKIHSPIHLNDWISQQDLSSNTELGLVLHHRDRQDLAKITPSPEKVTMLIGPEGGLTETEINQAISTGFVSTTLGPRVFRTETAPVAALSVINWLWGDFN